MPKNDGLPTAESNVSVVMDLCFFPSVFPAARSAKGGKRAAGGIFFLNDFLRIAQEKKEFFRLCQRLSWECVSLFELLWRK